MSLATYRKTISRSLPCLSEYLLVATPSDACEPRQRSDISPHS